MNNYYKMLLSFSVLFSATQGWANLSQFNCTDKKFTLKDFRVYAVSSVTAMNSDYQGSLGSGDSIELTNFLIEKDSSNPCISLSAQKNLYFEKGKSAGAVEAKDTAHLNQAHIAGETSSNNIIANSSYLQKKVTYYDALQRENSTLGKKERLDQPFETQINHLSIKNELYDLSKKLKQEPNQINISQCNELKNLNLNINKNHYIFSLNSSLLETCQLVVLKGNKNHSVTFNISGRNAQLVGFNVRLLGNIRYDSISWNFHESETLFISNTANGTYGIPGFVYAPLAQTEFYEGLITGGLYVNSIIFDMDKFKGQSSGQINRTQQTHQMLPYE